MSVLRILCTWLYRNIRTGVTAFVVRALLYLIAVHWSAVLRNDWDVGKKKAPGEPCKHPAHHWQGYLANKKMTAYHLITKAITLRLAICKRDSKKMQDAFCLTKDEDLHLCLLSWEMLFLSLPWSWEGKGSADAFRIRQALCHPRTGLLFSRLCAPWWISLFLWKHFTSAIMLGVSMCPGIQSNSHSEAEQAAWQQNRIPRTVQWASLKEREWASCRGSGKLFNSW